MAQWNEIRAITGQRVVICAASANKCCSNQAARSKMAFSGDFTPVLAKHTKHLSLVDVLSIGVDRIQRNLEPMKRQVGAWKTTLIPDESAKLVIYQAFVEGKLDVPKHIARRVHDLYFNPQVDEFAPTTT